MPIVTVPANDRRESFTASGGQTVFSYDFPVYAATDLLVTRLRLGAETTLALSTDYTVAGAGNQAGGTITLAIGALAADVITIASNQPAARSTAFTNGGDLPSGVLNDEFNRIIIALQQIERQLGRSVRISTGDGASGMVLPPVSQRAGKPLMFDALGNVTVLAFPGAPLWNAGSQVLAGSLSIAGTQAAGITPTVSPTLSLSSLAIEATTAAPAQREFLAALNFVSTQGAANVGTTAGSKIGFYVGLDAQAGTGDVWAGNASLLMRAGSGSYSAQAMQLDITNLAGHRGDAAGAFGLAAPVSYGLSLAGAGSFRNTAALAVLGPGAPVWNRGIVFHPNSVSQAAFQDLGGSATSIEIAGTHTHAIDTVAATTTNILRMPNSGRIAARNVGGSADISLLALSVLDQLILGGPGVSEAAVNGTFLPNADNTFSLGKSGVRWSSVWAVNGTIQTSDAREKTDIAPLPPCLDIVADIAPATFRWAEGGQDQVETMEEQLVPMREWQEREVPEIQMRDGRPVQVMVQRGEWVEVFDELPVVDERGAPVLIHVPAEPARHAPDGRLLHPGREALTIEKTHRVPRMERRQVAVQRLVPRAGRRTHWGFLAQDVHAAFDRRGLDFGGYIVSPEGQQGLRMDQLLPVLWRAVQEQQEQIAELREATAARKMRSQPKRRNTSD